MDSKPKNHEENYKACHNKIAQKTVIKKKKLKRDQKKTPYIHRSKYENDSYSY